MAKSPKGRAVIISNQYFTSGHTQRDGADIDVANLTEMFNKHLDFDVIVEKNKTAGVSSMSLLSSLFLENTRWYVKYREMAT